MLWSNGRRTDAATFFLEVTEPLANEYGIEAAFVRSKDRDGGKYQPIDDYIVERLPGADLGKAEGIDIPLFGSGGGKLKQACTSKWKIQGIRQELRRRGAKTARTSLGLTVEEMHRMKIDVKIKWHWEAWPLINYTSTQSNDTASMGLDRTWRRGEIQDELERRNIPYLVTSECDGCPHKDWPRWSRTSPATVAELAAFEALFQGEYFLTRELVPLPEALALMADRESMGIFEELDTCESGYCFT
jgi:hypothetical protein